jgi:beta-phosphoglucomutase
MTEIKAFVFDMDGVLTETSEQHYLAWKTLAEKLDISINREFNERLKGVSRMESLDEILKYGGQLDKYSEEEKIEFAIQKNENYKKMIESITEENLFEGVRELFEKLKQRGIKIAIGSASRNAPTLIDNMGIRKYIDYIVNPDEISKGKPAPDTFLKAAKELGFAPSQCIGVEDAIAGVEAIKAAGMYAIGIGDAITLSKADVVYKETKDIVLSE